MTQWEIAFLIVIRLGMVIHSLCNPFVRSSEDLHAKPEEMSSYSHAGADESNPSSSQSEMEDSSASEDSSSEAS